MKKTILIMFGLLPITLMANNQAIKKLNYNISTDYSQSDYTKGISIDADIRIPIMNYIGMGLNTNISRNESRKYDSHSNDKSLGLSLILRNSSIGQISTYFGYTMSNIYIKFDNNESMSSKPNSKNLNINAIYYFNDFDFSLNRSKSKLTSYSYDSFVGKIKDTSTYYSTSVNIAYYINNNLKISTEKNADYSYKTNINISYQPQVFKNSMVLFTSYYKNGNNKSYKFGLKYTFDTRVNLKDRNRKY